MIKKNSTPHHGWYFLLCYFGFSAFTIDLTMGTVMQSQLISVYHLDTQTINTYYHLVVWGFIIGSVLFGCLVDMISFKTCFIVTWMIHTLGLLKLVMLSTDATTQTIHHEFTAGMLLTGVGEGGILAIIHPLLSLIFNEPHQSKTKIMCYLHSNWPLMVIAGVSFEWFAKTFQLDWRVHYYVMFLFPMLYLITALLLPLPNQSFAHPIPLSYRIRSVIRPGFVLLFFCVAFTSTIERSPKTWITALLESTLHVELLYFLLFFHSIQFISRLSSGIITRWISPPGLVCLASVFSMIGLYLFGLSNTTTLSLAWIGAGIFSFSVAWYWPTFLAIVIDRYPLSGGLGMALINCGELIAMIILIPPITALAQSEGIHPAFLSLSLYAFLTVILLSVVYVFFRSQGGYKVLSSSEKSV